MADSGDTAPLLAKPSLNAEKAKAHEEEEEKHEELKAEAKAKERRVPILSLWRFALPRERVLLALAVAASVAHGALMPLFTVLFGDVIDAFDPTEDPDALADAVAAICVKFLILGAIAGATHLVSILAMPRLAPQDAYARVAAVAPTNRVALLPEGWGAQSPSPAGRSTDPEGC